MFIFFKAAKKGDLDKLEQDVNSMYYHLNDNQAKTDIDDIWNFFF